MKNLDTYLNLCTQVYDLSKPTAPKEDYAFYRSYAEEFNGFILEPMCGTGRFLLPLLQEGYTVHGFDASEHMLNALKEKALSLKLEPDVWQAYTNDLSRSERYSLIFIPSGSFNLITDIAIIITTLKIFFEHLTDDGVLIFEVETKHAVPPLGVWRASKWLRPDGKTILLSSCALMDDDIYSSIGKYELIDGNTIIQTEIEKYKIKIYNSEELLKILQEIGFNNLKSVKAFDRNAIPNDNDESVVYECRK